MEHFNASSKEKGIGGRNVSDPFILEESEKLNQRYNAESNRCLKERPEITNKIMSWIESIDPTEFEAIYKEYLSKSGVPLERFNFADRIYFAEDLSEAIMTYNGIPNCIRINSDYFEDFFIKNGEVATQVEFMRAFFTKACMQRAM